MEVRVISAGDFVEFQRRFDDFIAELQATGRSIDLNILFGWAGAGHCRRFFISFAIAEQPFTNIPMVRFVQASSPVELQRNINAAIAQSPNPLRTQLFLGSSLGNSVLAALDFTPPE